MYDCRCEVTGPTWITLHLSRHSFYERHNFIGSSFINERNHNFISYSLINERNHNFIGYNFINEKNMKSTNQICRHSGHKSISTINSKLKAICIPKNKAKWTTIIPQIHANSPKIALGALIKCNLATSGMKLIRRPPFLCFLECNLSLFKKNWFFFFDSKRGSLKQRNKV